METESLALGFKAWKPSTLHSFSRLRNRVLRTRFLCMQNQSNSHSHPTGEAEFVQQQNSDIGIQLLANEIDNNVNGLKHPSPVLAITPILVVNLGLF